LILENEYYSFFDLIPFEVPSLRANEDLSPFLHTKHMERNFLIFKEVSYSVRDATISIPVEEDSEENDTKEKTENVHVTRSEKQV